MRKYLFSSLKYKIIALVLVGFIISLISMQVYAAHHRKWVVDYVNKNTHVEFICHGMKSGIRTWNDGITPLSKKDLVVYYETMKPKKIRSHE